MAEKEEFQNIFSQKVRAGRRTYFFDVRSTKAEDYYMTITESVKSIDDEGNTSYRKHKIFLYKEDFKNFKETLEKVSDYIITEKGEEIISKKKTEKEEKEKSLKNKEESSIDFTEVNFEDLGK
tara:strand:- start:153 stop:521 length:369 start_codon:yes stop_codon:yes gene_type:complete